MAELTSECLDLFWPSRAEHQRLPIRMRDFSDNLLNIFFKPHIKHSICFIEHQVGYSSQISISILQKIEQSAWSRNQNLSPWVKHTFLVVLGSTTIDCKGRELTDFGKLDCLLLDLDSKLSCGCQHQHDWAISFLESVLSHHVDDCGHHEWERLTTSCLRDSNQISPLKCHWPSSALNNWRLLKVCLELINQILGQTGLFECCHRSRNILSFVWNEIFG